MVGSSPPFLWLIVGGFGFIGTNMEGVRSVQKFVYVSHEAYEWGIPHNM